MDELQNALRELTSLAFPDSSIEGEELAELFAQLAEADGYIVGIAQSVLAGDRAPFDRRELDCFEGLSRRFDLLVVSEDDRSVYEACRRYLKSIQKVADVLRRT